MQKFDTDHYSTKFTKIQIIAIFGLMLIQSNLQISMLGILLLTAPRKKIRKKLGGAVKKYSQNSDFLQNSIGEHKFARGHICKILSFCKKMGGGGGYDLYLQNSEFFKNSAKDISANIPLFGNVFVLTQAKMYLQHSGFLQKKLGDFTQLLYMQNRELMQNFTSTQNLCEWGAFTTKFTDTNSKFYYLYICNYELDGGKSMVRI